MTPVTTKRFSNGCRMAVVALALAAIAWPNAAPRADSGLTGTKWNVAELDGKPVTEAGWISFRQGSVGGEGACNGFMVELVTNGDALSFRQFIATQRHCEGRMDLERALFSALRVSVKAERQGETLLLADADGKPRVKLVK